MPLTQSMYPKGHSPDFVGDCVGFSLVGARICVDKNVVRMRKMQDNKSNSMMHHMMITEENKKDNKKNLTHHHHPRFALHG